MFTRSSRPLLPLPPQKNLCETHQIFKKLQSSTQYLKLSHIYIFHVSQICNMNPWSAKQCKYINWRFSNFIASFLPGILPLVFPAEEEGKSRILTISARILIPSNPKWTTRVNGEKHTRKVYYSSTFCVLTFFLLLSSMTEGKTVLELTYAVTA